MKRTKFPAGINGSAKTESTPEEDILEFATQTEKARLIMIKTDIQTRLFNIKNDTYKIGELLHEAKKIVPHGKFMQWIKESFNDELPYSTAYFYMRVYETFKDKPRTVGLVPTKYLLMLTQKEFPDEIIKLLKENPEKAGKKELQQVNETYDLLKKGIIGGSQFIKIAKDQIDLGIEVAWKTNQHRINKEMRQSFYYGAGDILKRIQGLIETARKMNGLYPQDPESKEYKELMKLIKDVIRELMKFRRELSQTDGRLIKHISTKQDGSTYI